MMTTRDELATVSQGFAAAAAAGDMDRLAAYYTDDAQLLLPNMPAVRGWSERAALFRSGGPFHIRFESGDILEDSDLVVDVGRYLNLDEPDGSVTGHGKYVVVYRREGGKLKMAVDAANSDMPAAG
jgi:ketosteroid isomerase-like protein